MNGYNLLFGYYYNREGGLTNTAFRCAVIGADEGPSPQTQHVNVASGAFTETWLYESVIWCLSVVEAEPTLCCHGYYGVRFHTRPGLRCDICAEVNGCGCKRRLRLFTNGLFLRCGYYGVVVAQAAVGSP